MPDPRVPALLRAAHPLPTTAVTVLAAVLALATLSGPGRAVLVTAAVLSGQLSIGWGNDLIDAPRDRAVGRVDKPLATGELPTSTTRAACVAALVGTVVLSLACGIVAGMVHLVCVAAGWSYNLGVKATVVSFLPYAIAFGGLPLFVALVEPGATLPQWSTVVAGALLGVGAHLVNVLPDLVDDEATGVRGLAHRIGPRAATLLTVGSLTAATAVIAVGAGAVPAGVLVLVVAAVVILAGVALFGSGRAPFRAAIGIAVLDVLLLVVAR
ncbi:UbiA family prenyltransferase [Janibacter sp. LM]|uniref:UbiA family prenyltransferase n=1 Tax=Janibacter sp. LM TaxID=3144845 RepID=UPI0031F5F3D3